MEESKKLKAQNLASEQFTGAARHVTIKRQDEGTLLVDDPRRLAWPVECIVCGGPAHHKSIVSGLWWNIWHEKDSLRAPACRAHGIALVLKRCLLAASLASGPSVFVLVLTLSGLLPRSSAPDAPAWLFYTVPAFLVVLMPLMLLWTDRFVYRFTGLTPVDVAKTTSSGVVIFRLRLKTKEMADRLMAAQPVIPDSGGHTREPAPTSSGSSDAPSGAKSYVALAVLAHEEPNGMLRLIGSDANRVETDLRQVRKPALLFVPRDTLPYLRRNQDVWEESSES